MFRLIYNTNNLFYGIKQNVSEWIWRFIHQILYTWMLRQNVNNTTRSVLASTIQSKQHLKMFYAANECLRMQNEDVN